MAEAAARAGNWPRRITNLALLLSLGGLAAASIAAIGSGQGAWPFRAGFTVLRYALFAVMGGAVIALIGLFLARRRRAARLAGLNLLALVAALGFLLYLVPQIRTARTVPAIHDVSTDLQNLPQFTALKVREDNLEVVPDNDDAALKAMEPESRWKALHRQAYSDIRPIRVPWGVEETIRRAERLARERGWEVAKADPAAGILEATDTTFFFRFKDDVIVRAQPYPEVKGGTRVDMRSISRVGVSDVGVNAKRVRAFLKDLQKS